MGSYKETESGIKDFASDALITTEVKAKLMATENIPSMDISVKTEQGVVNLTGSVKSDEQKTKAESVVKVIKGVKSVQNDLSVASE